MFDEAYFRNHIQQFYQDVDKGFRTLGCEVLGSQDIYYRLSRVATPEVEFSEIKRILAEVDAPPSNVNEPSGHRRWPLAWGRAVERYRSIAEQAEAREYIVTAGQNYLRASLLAHSGQLFCRPEWPEKRSLQEARVQYYQNACGHLGIKRFLIPFGTHSLPAYLWLPNCNEKPPLVIMVPGANSVKEELHRWAGPFVRRGLATLRFDGPGQGEMSPAVDGGIPLRMEDYHLVLTTVIDFVEEKLADKVDTSRIALWGQATGGHLITRVFQYEKRPVAAVNLNGQPDMQAYPFLAGDVQEENRIALGFSSYEETWAYLQAHGDAKPAASAINVPYLLIFGMRGDLAGYAAMQSFAASIGENVQMHSYPDGNHGVFNWDFIMTDAMADWLTEKLSK